MKCFYDVAAGGCICVDTDDGRRWWEAKDSVAGFTRVQHVGNWDVKGFSRLAVTHIPSGDSVVVTVYFYCGGVCYAWSSFVFEVADGRRFLYALVDEGVLLVRFSHNSMRAYVPLQVDENGVCKEVTTPSGWTQVTGVLQLPEEDTERFFQDFQATASVPLKLGGIEFLEAKHLARFTVNARLGLRYFSGEKLRAGRRRILL